jgi:hypothetical protein
MWRIKIGKWSFVIVFDFSKYHVSRNPRRKVANENSLSNDV